MEPVWTGAAANTISSVVSVGITPLMRLIDDVIHLDENTLLLEDKLSRMRNLLQDISSQLQHDQRSPPRTVKNWLQRLHHSLEDAKGLIDRSQKHRQSLDCFFCKPRLSRQIRKWNSNFDQLFSNLQSDFSSLRNAQEIVSSAPLQTEALLQTVPESGYVGTGIKSAEKQLNTWLNMEDHQFRVIGVYGMGGVGKTSLLKIVYNTYKKGNVFELVIWLTVSQKFNILDLQTTIASAINLKLGIDSNSNAESSSAAEMRKMRLCNYLKEKKFLLILDDMWNPIQLEEKVGIPFSNDKGSKVVISTRSIDVIRRMGADDSYSIPIKPLSPEEGWQLFCRVAFKAGGVPAKSIEDIARQVAGECKGLPLAINVVAAAMIGNNTSEWRLALNQMKSVDPGFRTMFTGIDEGLYNQLKFSYDCLPDSNFKNCFLYCGAFAEDTRINVDTLVEMWIGEGLVHSRDRNYLMDVGRRYVKMLVERCLFEYDGTDDTDIGWIKVHDVVHDMALYIAEKEENCLFRTSQRLDQFPEEQGMDDCKRIAIRYYNDSAFLPTDFRCPKLQTLILAQNESLREVPNGFLLDLTSLRILDLSRTRIESLPNSMWDLKQLEFLQLGYTSIKDLPEGICNLSRLQFLYLCWCRRLNSLPCQIGQLKNLKHLNLEGSSRLTQIPLEISQLTSLNKLKLMTPGKSMLNVEEAKIGVCSLKDFTNFPNLMELSVNVKPGIIVDGIKSGIKVGTMGTWLEMRHLNLKFDVYSPEVMEDLPQDMQNMKNLQIFDLKFYQGISLPNCVCDFELLEKLYLGNCYQLGELPPLERLPNLRIMSLTACTKLRELGIGIRERTGGFPMLESLYLDKLSMLESISSSSSNIVWDERTIPKLKILSIVDCKLLKRLPMGIEKLPSLTVIKTDKDIWEGLIWEDNKIKTSLENSCHLSFRPSLEIAMSNFPCPEGAGLL